MSPLVSIVKVSLVVGILAFVGGPPTVAMGLLLSLALSVMLGRTSCSR
jgi:hypothetical protein